MDVQLDSHKWVRYGKHPFVWTSCQKFEGHPQYISWLTRPGHAFFEIQKYHMGSYGWNWFLCIFRGISLRIETDLNRLADAKLLFGWVISVPRRENLLFDPFHYLFLFKPSQFFLKLRFERLAISNTYHLQSKTEIDTIAENRVKVRLLKGDDETSIYARFTHVRFLVWWNWCCGIDYQPLSFEASVQFWYVNRSRD